MAPSVVGIRAIRHLGADLPGTYLDDTFGGVQQHVIVNGSGSIISPDGLILTNEHVIRAATQVEVMLHNSHRLEATIVASDSRSDLAVLQIDRTGLQPVRMCDWNAVTRGQWVIVLGNPFGLGGDGQLSVSVGVVL